MLESRNDYRKRECGNLHKFWTHETPVSEEQFKDAMSRVYNALYMRRKLKE